MKELIDITLLHRLQVVILMAGLIVLIPVNVWAFIQVIKAFIESERVFKDEKQQ